MMEFVNLRNTNGMVAEQFDQTAHKRGLQERHVARGKIRRVRPAAQCFESGCQSLKRAPTLFRIASDFDARRNRWHILTGCGDHNDWRYNLAQNAEHSWQHEF